MNSIDLWFILMSVFGLGMSAGSGITMVMISRALISGRRVVRSHDGTLYRLVPIETHT